jgi:UDP:flavonoid glycosyltransferase YjiC (YdhE family)
MRALFSFAGGSGHAEPLVPIARAVQTAGHRVAFVGRHSAVAPLEAFGFDLFPEGAPSAQHADSIAELLPVDMPKEYAVLREAYADRFARAAIPRLLEVIASWRPDVVICDEVDFGAMLAAEIVGVPRATVLVTASGSFVRADVIGETLNAVRADHGLPTDPDLAMLRGDLVLSPFSSSFRDPSRPLPPKTVSLRSQGPTSTEAGGLPRWPGHRADRRTVYFTLGTVFNRESGDLFPRVLSGVRELPVNVVVTVGRHLDVGILGPQPANVHVERYLSHATLLPSCDLVVNHGGSGTVIGSLAHGLPVVVLPMGADQPLNAARCEQLGVGLVLDALGATPESIRDAVRSVLEGPSYRLAADRLRSEIAALAPPEAAVGPIERLALREMPPSAKR